MLQVSLVIWCVTCLIHGCSLTRLPPLPLPLLHLPIQPHNENTQYIPHISKLTQSTSSAIKNQSGVKTCRVAETRAQQSKFAMCPSCVSGRLLCRGFPHHRASCCRDGSLTVIQPLWVQPTAANHLGGNVLGKATASPAFHKRLTGIC